jgi:hypothetical protein
MSNGYERIYMDLSAFTPIEDDYDYSCGDCDGDDGPGDMDECENDDPGDMDGDFDSGMRDAGFGTDEDYGYYGGDDDY